MLLVVGQAVLKANVEKGQVTPPHQLAGLEICSHGLIVLVLHGKAVPVGKPGRTQHPVQLCRLLQVPDVVPIVLDICIALLCEYYLLAGSCLDVR